MTKERLIELRDQIQSEIQLHQRNYQAANGAAQILEKLITEWDAQVGGEHPVSTG